MKKEIRLMFDYQCYPIWIYDENGNFIDNDLVEHIENDDEIVAMLEELQHQFDSLYLDSKEEFRYVGFASEEDRKNFERNVLKVYSNLCTLLDEKYIVKNMVDFHNM